jgi:asparagine synthetase A
MKRKTVTIAPRAAGKKAHKNMEYILTYGLLGASIGHVRITLILLKKRHIFNRQTF